jgi:2'-5' RNA ligase
MNELRDYALWIIPEGNAYIELKQLIDLLSQMYSTPSFDPHITVVGRVTGSGNELIVKATRLAGIIRPFLISLRRIEYLDEYFRCLFIRSDESNELINLHNKAKTIFNIKDKKCYMPHISLMYGNLPAHLKEKTISDIGKDFPNTFEIQRIHLVSASIETAPTEWHSVKEFPLG